MKTPPKIRVELDYRRYSTMLNIVSAVASGECSPLFLEEQVRELKEFIPFLPTAVSWMAEAIDRVYQAKNGDIENDPAALKEFLLQNEMLCRSQGAVAALLGVAEELRVMSQPGVKETKPTSRKPRRKKNGPSPGGVQGSQE